MKNIMNEMKEVTWLSGKELTKETTYVLVFAGSLLLYFTVIDKILSTGIEKFLG